MRLLKATCVGRPCIQVGDVNGKHRLRAAAAEWRNDRHRHTKKLGSAGMRSPIKRLQHSGSSASLLQSVEEGGEVFTYS